MHTVVLDEADEMLDMGFREDIDTILSQAPEKRQTLLFSATLSKEIMAIAGEYLTDPARVQVAPRQVPVPSIDQYYLEVRAKDKFELLTRLIDSADLKLTLVFCKTKRRCEEVSEALLGRGAARGFEPGPAGQGHGPVSPGRGGHPGGHRRGGPGHRRGRHRRGF